VVLSLRIIRARETDHLCLGQRTPVQPAKPSSLLIGAGQTDVSRETPAVVLSLGMIRAREADHLFFGQRTGPRLKPLDSWQGPESACFT
jgi:hypothetical protein